MGFRGAVIKKLRKDRGLTQKGLAEKADVSQAMVSRVEAGEVEKRPDRNVAVRLARALGVRLADVWDEADGEGDAPEEHPVERKLDDESDPYEAALLTAAPHFGTKAYDAARAALRQVRPLVTSVDPDVVAREWLAATVALRAAGREASPLAIVTHVALEALRRAASPSADTKPTATKKTRAA